MPVDHETVPTDAVGDDLVRTYRAGARRLELLVRTALEAGLDPGRIGTPAQLPGDATAAYRERQLRAARLIIAELEATGRRAAPAVTEAAYRSALVAVDRTVIRAGAGNVGLAGQFGGIHQRAVEALAANMTNSLTGAAQRAGANLDPCSTAPAPSRAPCPSAAPRCAASRSSAAAPMTHGARSRSRRSAPARSRSTRARRSAAAWRAASSATASPTRSPATSTAAAAGGRWTAIPKWSPGPRRARPPRAPPPTASASTASTSSRSAATPTPATNATTTTAKRSASAATTRATTRSTSTRRFTRTVGTSSRRPPPTSTTTSSELDGEAQARLEEARNVAPPRPRAPSTPAPGPRARGPRRVEEAPPAPPETTMPAPAGAGAPFGGRVAPMQDAQTLERLEAQRVAYAIADDPGPEAGAAEAWGKWVDKEGRAANRALNVGLGDFTAKYIDRKAFKELRVRERLLHGELGIADVEDMVAADWEEREGRRLSRKQHREQDYGYNRRPVPCFSCGSLKRRPADVCAVCGDDPVSTHTGTKATRNERAMFNREYGYSPESDAQWFD
jgi:hypothetical protein